MVAPGEVSPGHIMFAPCSTNLMAPRSDRSFTCCRSELECVGGSQQSKSWNLRARHMRSNHNSNRCRSAPLGTWRGHMADTPLPDRRALPIWVTIAWTLGSVAYLRSQILPSCWLTLAHQRVKWGSPHHHVGILVQDAQGGEPGAVALCEEQRLPVHYHQLHMLRAAHTGSQVHVVITDSLVMMPKHTGSAP